MDSRREPQGLKPDMHYLAVGTASEEEQLERRPSCRSSKLPRVSALLFLVLVMAVAIGLHWTPDRKLDQESVRSPGLRTITLVAVPANQTSIAEDQSANTSAPIGDEDQAVSGNETSALVADDGPAANTSGNASAVSGGTPKRSQPEKPWWHIEKVFGKIKWHGEHLYHRVRGKLGWEANDAEAVADDLGIESALEGDSDNNTDDNVTATNNTLKPDGWDQVGNGTFDCYAYYYRQWSRSKKLWCCCEHPTACGKVGRPGHKGEMAEELQEIMAAHALQSRDNDTCNTVMQLALQNEQGNSTGNSNRTDESSADDTPSDNASSSVRENVSNRSFTQGGTPGKNETGTAALVLPNGTLAEDDRPSNNTTDAQLLSVAGGTAAITTIESINATTTVAAAAIAAAAATDATTTLVAATTTVLAMADCVCDTDNPYCWDEDHWCYSCPTCDTYSQTTCPGTCTANHATASNAEDGVTTSALITTLAPANTESTEGSPSTIATTTQVLASTMLTAAGTSSTEATTTLAAAGATSTQAIAPTTVVTAAT